MVIANFEKGQRVKMRVPGLWKYDYGQVLRIQGLSLPPAVEIHFSLQETGGQAVTRIGTTKDGVTDVPIPGSMLENETTSEYYIYAFIYLRDETSGQTEYKISMSVRARPKPEGWSGFGENTMTAILTEINKIANGKADNLKYEGSVLKLLSGETELSRATIDSGGGEGSTTADRVAYGDSDVGTALDELNRQIADINYEAIQINSFTNNIGSAEMGSIVNTVILSWSCNKTPTALLLDENAIDVSLNTLRIEDTAISADKTFTIEAVDERESVARKETTIIFLNGIYWGVAGDTSELDSEFLLTLTKNLQGARAKTFIVNAGTGQFIYYAAPTRYGTPAFKVGGFDGGFTKAATIQFTNGSGYTESYDIWKSDNAGLGNTTVAVT